MPTIDGEAVFLVNADTLMQRGLLLTNPIPTFGPLRGAISPDGAYLYAASWVWQPVRVSVVDVQDERVVGEIVTGPGLACDSPSWDLDVAPDGRTLYVLCSNNRSVLHIVNELSDNVLTMDTATNQLTGVVSLLKCLTHLPLVLGNYQ